MSLDKVSIEYTFSPCLWIKSLTDLSVYNQIKEHSESFKDDESLNIIKGYEFLFSASLYQFIDGVIRSPETFDIPFDEGLKDAWSSSRNRGRESLTKYIRKSSPVSYVFNRVNIFWNDLLRAKTWDELEPVRIALSSWSIDVIRGFRFSYRSRTSRYQLHTNPELTLIRPSIDWLWPEMSHIGHLSGIYRDIYVNTPKEQSSGQNDDEWSMAEELPRTRFDEKEDFSFPRHHQNLG